MMELLMRLLDVESVSGDECEVRQIIATEMKKYVKDIEVDKFGNLICRKKGKGPSILLAAHMDEVGLMVRRIDANGRIYFSAIGGIEAYSLLGERVKIRAKGGHVRGIITVNEMQDGDLLEEMPPLTDLYIDAGLAKKALNGVGVRRGSYISFDAAGSTLGSKDVISGKALDDRLGCYAMIELAKRLKGFNREIIFLFTVQEEVGLFGAKAAQVQPDIGLIMETTTADDSSLDATKIIGKGPCITIKDAEMIANRRLNELIMGVAKKHRIPYQLEVSDFGTTDGLSISISHGGVPISVIGVPIRNIHSAISVAHMKDVRNSIKLAEKFIRTVKFNPKKNVIKDGLHVC
jgi:tetrahedral aminopeptidase